MTESASPPGMRGLPWVLAALASAVAPHVPHLPAWVSLLLLAIATWRWLADARSWPLPPVWLRVVLVLLSAAAILATYRTLNGLEAGTAFLVLMAAAKLLETRTARDLTVLVFIAWFLLYAALLRDQGLPYLPWLLASAYLSAVALMRVHAAQVQAPARHILRRTAWLHGAGRAARTAAVPAVSAAAGTVLGHRLAHRGAHGTRRRDDAGRRLGPERLGRSRVPRALPRRDARARAALLARTGAARVRRAQLAAPAGAGVSGHHGHAQGRADRATRSRCSRTDAAGCWRSTCRPTWPEREISQSFDLTLLAAQEHQQRHRVRPGLLSATRSRASTCRSRRAARTSTCRATAPTRAAWPWAASSPRVTRATRSPSSGEMLRTFREQPFVYTMQPPRLADNAVDEFLFETRKGFCEHYASAFTVVMRAAGVPARVVTGYQGGEFNPLGGYLIVRQSDAHAWAEVWIRDRGWLRVDPTAAVAPERIQGGLIDAVGADEPVPGRLREASDAWLQVELGWDIDQRILEPAHRPLRRAVAVRPARAARHRRAGLARARSRPGREPRRVLPGADRLPGVAPPAAAARLAGTTACGGRAADCAGAAWSPRPPRARSRILERAERGLPGPRPATGRDPAPVRVAALRSGGRGPRTLQRLKHAVNSLRP